ncbi:MAG: hypothetical protein JW881_13710 [Spirochaetales bacterium]|nr:hypothetical protein [Spirochaetales bacterium]
MLTIRVSAAQSMLSGGNEQSVRLMGLPVNSTRVAVYPLTVFCSALAGITHSIYIGGADGILSGFYISPNRPSVPITPAGKSAEWSTEVAVPGDVKGLYIMLSVESGKQRLFTNYCIDITDK